VTLSSGLKNGVKGDENVEMETAKNVTVVYILFHRRNVTKFTRQEILDIEKLESTILANTPFF